MQNSSSPKTALILVDIQNDYFPGGKNELHGSLEAGSQAGRLLEHFRRLGWDIVHIQHLSIRPGARFFLPGTSGAEIHASVQPLAHETIIQKHYPNSFRETGLLEHLQTNQVNRLVIAGMMTHMCVEATTRAAYDFRLRMPRRCRRLRHQRPWLPGPGDPAGHVHAAFLAALQGTYAKVLTVEEIIDLLGE